MIKYIIEIEIEIKIKIESYRMPSNKSRSKYADYFTIRRDTATCNKCGKILKITDGNTTSLAYHCNKVCNIKITPPSPKESKECQGKQQSTLDGFVKIEKPSKEEIISKEASLGATFNFCVKSPSVKKNMSFHGYNAPKATQTIGIYVHRSANKHREKMKMILQNHLKNGQRFCALTDEWTCPEKKRKYLNVQLHLKGKKHFIIRIIIKIELL